MKSPHALDFVVTSPLPAAGDDLTAAQFEVLPDYSKARGRGFLTAEPSGNAAILMVMLTWQFA